MSRTVSGVVISGTPRANGAAATVNCCEIETITQNEQRVGTSDQRQAVHGAGGVPQSVQDSICRNQPLCLTHNATAH